MKKKVVILGGFGNGAYFADIVRDIDAAGGEYELMGFLNDHMKVGADVFGSPVLGPLEKSLDLLKDPGIFFLQGLLTVKKFKERIARIEELGIPIERYARLIHPSAVVSESASLGFGSALMPFSLIQSNVTIGDHCWISNNCNVSHDTRIGDYAFISPNAAVGSYVDVGRGVFIGMSASICVRLKIGEFATVGMGAVVLKDIEADAVAVGNPARIVGRDR